MELKVFWTETAIEQLEDIFDFYKYKASHKIAKSIVTDLIHYSTLVHQIKCVSEKAYF